MLLDSLLTPENLNSVQGLELLARITVNTFQSGLNTSQKVGMGQEFSQYRSYQKGDDIRMLDWKVYARTERFYIREADLQAHIHLRFIIDNSASMLHEDGDILKIDYAKYLAATLAYLGKTQGDPIGLYAINTISRIHVPSNGGHTHFYRFLHGLAQLEPQERLPRLKDLQRIIPDVRTKDLYIVITDMYELENELHELVYQLSATKNEVLLIHLLGKNEWEMDYPVATFEDLETGIQIQAQPEILRKKYQEALDEKISLIKKEMLRKGIAYELLYMNAPIYNSLSQLLLRRRKLLS